MRNFLKGFKTTIIYPLGFLLYILFMIYVPMNISAPIVIGVLSLAGLYLFVLITIEIGKRK